MFELDVSNTATLTAARAVELPDEKNPNTVLWAWLLKPVNCALSFAQWHLPAPSVTFAMNGPVLPSV